MRVRFAPEALARLREMRAWWVAHREKAPGLFIEELALIVGKLRDGNDAERQAFTTRSGIVVWRLLMPRTRRHVYYRVSDRGDEIVVITVWNATAGAPPDL